MVPDGFSFDSDNPLYRRFKSGEQILEYSLDGGHLSIDWVDGGGAGTMLKHVLGAEGGSVRRISGYVTDKLGRLSDEALLRYGRQVAKQLGNGWTVTIRMDGTKKFLEFTR